MPGPNAYVDLGRHVVDKTLADRHGRRCGKVDDLVLDLTDGGSAIGEQSLWVVALVCGPLALARLLPPPLPGLARAVYRLLGEPGAGPAAIPWSRITAIDVIVHLDVDADAAGLRTLARAVDRCVISRLPGSGAPAGEGPIPRGQAPSQPAAQRDTEPTSEVGSGISLTYHDLVGRSAVTADGRLVGRIVDLRSQPVGERLRVTALLVGPTAFLHRITTMAPARAIPWRVVARLGNRVELRVTSAELARLDRERR